MTMTVNDKKATTDNNPNLTLTNLTPNTVYLVRVRPECIAEANCMESELSDPIRTKPKACPPGKPKECAKTHNSITLEWDKPENFKQTNKVSYTVLHRVANDYSESTKDWKTKRVEGNVTRTMISPLLPNTQYIFKVLLKLEDGQSIESSNSDPITTNPLVCQPSKPRASIVAESRDSIRIVWDKPKFGFESVRSYIVSYRTTTDDLLSPWKQHITDGLTEKVTLSALAAGKQYVFKVYPHCRAVNSKLVLHESKESDPIQVPQDCQPSIPIPMEITHNSITLKWGMPQFSVKTIHSYTVSYCTVTEFGKWEQEHFKSTTYRATIGGLKPNKQYFFKVLPNSGNISTNCIESDISEPITTKTIECQPGKPTAYIQTGPESHNSICLKWDKPKCGNDYIESYIVYSHNISEHTKPRKQFTEGSEEQATVNGLAFNTQYVFTVAPFCSTSNSEYSFLESEQSDPIQIKSLPSKPEATYVTCNSVQLKWKMQSTTCDVDFYTVSYRMKNDSVDKWRNQSTKNAETNFTVTELKTATSYIFKITSVDKTGNTSTSDESCLICTTNTTKPGKPTATCTTDASIHLKWSHPEVGQGCIDNYTVLYCPATEDSKVNTKWNTRLTDGFTNEIDLLSLAHNTEYVFKVRPECGSATKECESEISDPIQTKATSEPEGVELTSVTESTIELKWEKPVRGQESIKSYDVYYQEASSNEWKKKNVGSSLNCKVSGLLSLKEYNFKVIPVCSIGTGAESVVVKAKTKQLVCKPGEIIVVQKKHTSIKLKWARPKYGNPKSYTCSYRCVAESKWQGNPQKTATEEIEITGLNPYTTYIFRVYPELEDADIDTEETTSAWIATEKVPVAERLKTKCTVITGGDCTVYKIPIKTLWKGEQANIARYELDLDPPTSQYTSEKVVMFVGATGAGKSTLINGIINYIFKVEFEDKFRFQLIHDENNQGQTQSQTSSVNAYTIYPVAGSRLDYTLTIIDTPGFGDTRGVEQDNELFGQIKDFFTRNAADHKGIDQIHGVGFVVKNPDVRLTATQRYISSSILSVFGHDIKDNIFLMVTFADGATPPVLEAVKEVKVPHKEHFKFNNSALYPETGSNDPVTLPLWNMGRESFRRFFLVLENYKPQSLTLTREVLEERERLEFYVKTLREKINEGVQEIDKLEQLKENLKKNEKHPDFFKDFKVKVDVTKQRKVDLPRGVYVTNCLTCNRTCHDNCTINSDEQKYKCCVMRPKDPTHARCTVCQQHCSWRKHVNSPYKFEVYIEPAAVEQTIEDLKKYHDEAESSELDVETTIKDFEKGVDDLHEHVMSLVTNLQKSLARLGEIALKPNPPTNVHADYIDLLIAEERQDCRIGYEKRIAAYKQLKKRVKFLEKTVMSSTAATQDPAAAANSGRQLQKQKRWYLFSFWSKSD